MKKVCVLQVTPDVPNSEHIIEFKDQKDSDFFFVTYKQNSNEKNHLGYFPNTSWAETRNKLYELVPKEYEYYAFIDYDYKLISRTSLSFKNQMIKDLNIFNPGILIPYPGNGNSSHLVKDINYLKSNEYTIEPFTHCGLKIIHQSLMKWFFPMETTLDGWWSSCHYFNILEIPFLKYSVCSHNLIYENTKINNWEDDRINKIRKLNMDKLWMWIRPYFNKRHLIPHEKTYVDSLDIKKYYLEVFKKKNFQPIQNEKEKDFFDQSRIEEFFDLDFDLIAYKFNRENKNKNILVSVGNGPSLKKEYFDLIKNLKIDSISMNAAYRFYEDMKWYPTYFCCFDYALTESHKENYSKLIENSPIKKFFLLEGKEKNFFFDEKIMMHKKFVGRSHNQDGIGFPKYGSPDKKMSSTGVNSVRVGAELRYKKILLIGHNCKYIDKIAPIQKITDWKRKILQTPEKNPNYFWNDYQRAGDLYHKPGSQVSAWENLKECIQSYCSETEIINCTENSEIKSFRKGIFEKEILL